jgi:orotidine-5'-phosphate decarboxylase
LPDGFPATLGGVERFCEVLLDAAAPYAAAVKPNLAFFEAFGSAGIAALERLRGRVPAEVPFVADAKRGDIGTTAARQAVALFDILGVDAVTANPYLGSEAIESLISRGDRFAYLLCRTSNPGAGELQGLEVAADAAMGAPAEPLYARVARLAQTWGPGGTVGLVVGATAPVELERIRGIAPGLALLVPGVGAQGGEVEPVLRFGPAVAAPAGGRPGGGLLVNVSRGISGAAGKAAGTAGARSAGGAAALHGDVAELLAAAAREWSARLHV